MSDSLEQLVELQQETNTLLRAILESLKQNQENLLNTPSKRKIVLTQEQQDDIEESMMSLDDWFRSYGEEARPAKYINVSGLPFNNQESIWVYNRLVEIASMNPTNEAGTHVFKSLGRIYSKSEKNTVNCFAFVPKK